MTPENQRIAIARACGWTDIVRKNNLFFGLFGKKPRPPRTGLGGGADTEPLECNVPDYCNSLDAMHEAEKHIPVERFDEYVCMVEWVAWLDKKHSIAKHKRELVKAKPEVKAEAMLRALELWT